MKKFSLVLMIMLVVVLVATTGNNVEAIDETIYYTANNPRFQYNVLSGGEDTFISIMLDTQREYYTDPNSTPNDDLYVRQYDSDNNFVKTVFQDFNFLWERNATISVASDYGTCDSSTNPSEIYYAEGAIGEVGEIISVFNVTQGVDIPYGADLEDPLPSDYYYNGYEDKLDNDTYYVALYGISPCTSGDSIRITYELTQGTQYFYDRLITFTTLDFEDNDEGIYYYKIFVNDKIVNTGAFMETPIDDVDTSVDGEGIEIGNYFGSGYKSNYEQEDYTLTRSDDFIILHYELTNIYTYGSQARELVILFTDIATNTTAFSFDTTDLLMYQNFDQLYDTGVLIEAVKHSFIIIPISDTSSMIDVLETDYQGLNDRMIYNDFEFGAYMPVLYDGDNTDVIDFNTTLMLYTNTLKQMPFVVYLESDDLEIEEMQKVLLISNDIDNVAGLYTTITAKDNVMNYNYATLVNDNEARNFYARYRITDYVGTIGFTWDLIPSSMPYGLDPNDYAIELSATYTTEDNTSTESKIFDLFDYYGVDTQEEQILVYIIIMIILNVITIVIAYKIGNILVPVVFTNILGIFLGTAIGILPMWAIIGLALLLIIMVFRLLNAQKFSRGEE